MPLSGPGSSPRSHIAFSCPMFSIICDGFLVVLFHDLETFKKGQAPCFPAFFGGGGVSLYTSDVSS